MNAIQALSQLSYTPKRIFVAKSLYFLSVYIYFNIFWNRALGSPGNLPAKLPEKHPRLPFAYIFGAIGMVAFNNHVAIIALRAMMATKSLNYGPPSTAPFAFCKKLSKTALRDLMSWIEPIYF